MLSRLDRIETELHRLQTRVETLALPLQTPPILTTPPESRFSMPVAAARRPLVRARRFAWDGVAIVSLMAVAIPLRFVHLASMPFGFHGDEAAMGIEAGRILKRGWIGVYSGESGGTPAGPYYAVAAAVHFFGNTIYAVRFSAAVFDTITVVLVFALVRRNFGRSAGVITGFFVATSAWHLEFARIGFINSAWPFCVVAATIALGEAARTGSRPWWFICGALMASGLYAYPGHLLFLSVLALFLLCHFAGWRGIFTAIAAAGAVLLRGPIGLALAAFGLLALAVNPRMRTRAALEQMASFTVGFGLASWPMVRFIQKQPDTYFRTGRNVSIFDDPTWKATHGVLRQAHFLANRYLEFWNRLLRHPFPDSIDGTGAAALVPELMAVLCVTGIAWLIWRRRDQPLVRFGALVVFAMPLAVATSNSYPLRRASIIAPFIAMFAALALVELFRFGGRHSSVARAVAALAASLAIAQITYANLDDYFGKTVNSSGMYWTLAGDLVHSVNAMNQLPPDAYVYLYAERWPFDSGERMYLAPAVKGESRDGRFGINSYGIDRTKGKPVMVLVGKYENAVTGLQVMYPDGTFKSGPRDRANPTNPSFIEFYPNAP